MTTDTLPALATAYPVSREHVTAFRRDGFVRLPGVASAAEAAGFRPGDLIVTINRRSIETFTDMQRIVSTHAGDPLDIAVNRGGQSIEIKATPKLTEMKDNFGNVHRIGVLGKRTGDTVAATRIVHLPLRAHTATPSPAPSA